MAQEEGKVVEDGEGAGDPAHSGQEPGGEVVGDALEMGVTVLVELGRGAPCGDIGGQRPEAGGGHVQRLPDPFGGELVEVLVGEVLGEVAEDEGGPVGVLDRIAGRAVQGFVEDAVSHVLRVGAVEVLQLGSQGDAGGVGQQVADGDGPERVAIDLGPEVAQGDVEVKLAFLSQAD